MSAKRWLVLAMAVLGCACGARAPYPELELQRQLLPGLDTLKEDEIRAALDRPLEVKAPATAGVAWLSEAPGGWGGEWYQTPLTEYQRTGVINATLEALGHPPFSEVTSLPTVAATSRAGGDGNMLVALRSAAARFQADVAILMQTGTAEGRGLNAFAIGFVGLVTAPLVPAVDVAVASSAELCAVDVRSGVMIACTRGRAEERRNYLFLFQEARVREQLRENTVRAAAVTAAQDLVRAAARRLTSE
ncbi:MAG: hypothetical protein KatS3mg077_2251 [Candidatus Binatia bacterium]|nr:MAG: hypothetical protein KatS3mg077_2251 [Candidatus Binatia bacterium]